MRRALRSSRARLRLCLRPHPLRLKLLLCAITAFVALACPESEPTPSDSAVDTNGSPDAAPAIDPPSVQQSPSGAQAASHDAPPSLYFGDLHVHTAWSLDAFEQGVRAEPEAAYRFARGEAIPHAAGGTIALSGPPLDFLAITDHAEYLGVTSAALQKKHPLHRQPLIQSWIGSDPRQSTLAKRRLFQTYRQRQPFPALVADDVLPPAWQAVVEAANAHDQPGVFTAFIGFEYSSNPESQNLHRNVIFRGGRVPEKPFSAFDSQNPEDLWDWMDAARSRGDDLLAIPHNANGSNGLMFAETRFDGTAIDAGWAEQRIRNEPLAEVFQIKGQSDTTPSLSPADPWADFELAPWRTLDPNLPSRPAGSYLRDAHARGLEIRARLGVDPYALGRIGSTDTHNAASPVVESRYFGKLGRADGTPATRLGPSRAGPNGNGRGLEVSAYWSAAGLAGVWASENTRAALFDALRRRETFATSGPRLRVHVEAGFEGEPDRVPMGGTLAAKSGASSPRFTITAQQDPLEAPLERLQILKLWRTASGERGEQIFDVGCWDQTAPDPTTHRCTRAAKAPDPDDCRIDPDQGARELSGRWHDPEFDPGAQSVYSVRVLQIPTCRWSSFDAIALGRPPATGIPATIQERAITSPIWVLPAKTPTPLPVEQPAEPPDSNPGERGEKDPGAERPLE